jgi:carbonic anhydrase/acetyltransferase-like protein (isoleucine patch superfamily)
MNNLRYKRRAKKFPAFLGMRKGSCAIMTSYLDTGRKETLTEDDTREDRFRPLSTEQIAQLTEQGCSCEDWSQVKVADGFKAETVKSTHFCGRIRLGVFDKQVSFFGGVKKPAGISHATIHNCTIGNNVYIGHVRNYIANYVIEDDVVIDNIDQLAVEGKSTFGNGTEVAVVNESGGTEIPIYDQLSAHTAYIIAFYRHRPEVIGKLQQMIANYSVTVKSSMGLVGKGARLLNCRIIKNVKVGAASVIEGVSRLQDGSINSCADDPVYMGSGVFAEDFIVCDGSKIIDGTIISKCFIGQGTVLAKQYSAENSVFFANCGGFHGEACSVFAGPYTVTHHKSTLLIAGLFSFLNAGSGTNQSNHMYKLGPTHQGIVERGSKTASDSYILWPAKVGAFTVVMGRHYKNSDTSDLPFSYLIEHEDESVLVPGVNLRKVGTVRDARKWPRRDRRKDANKLDFIHFKLLSPYTIQKMLCGCQLLSNLKATSGQNTEYYTYHSVKINNSSLDRGIRLYQMGIDKFLGNCLIKQLENKQFTNVDELRDALMPRAKAGPGKWIDLAGLFAPEQVVQKLLSDIENDIISTPEQLAEAFESIYNNYPAYEWAWAANVLQQGLGIMLDRITPIDIIELVKKWKTAVIELDRMLYADTKKEFAETAQIGYGLDGIRKTMQDDFEQVRGTFEDNSFVLEIKKHITSKTALGDKVISQMQQLAGQ